MNLLDEKDYLNWCNQNQNVITQLTSTCSKSTIETL